MACRQTQKIQTDYYNVLASIIEVSIYRHNAEEAGHVSYVT